MATINIKQAREILDFSITHGLKRSLLFLGAPGIGKSEFVAQAAHEHSMNLIDFRLLYFSESDLKGIPMPNDSRNSTQWLPNDILPNASRDGERGILLIEELTSAPKRVQAAAYQLTLDRKLGEYTLPDGWFIVAAGNREDDDGVYVQMPSPLANRFQIHEIVPDLSVWRTEYAYRHGVNPMVMAYLQFDPSAFHTQEPGENSMVFASPRSWKAVSDIMNSEPELFSIEASDERRLDFIRAIISGNVGEVTANKFIEYCRNYKSIALADDILAGKPYDTPKDKSLIFLMISALVTKIRESALAHEKDVRKKIHNAVKFFVKLENPEYMTVGLRDLISISPKAMVKIFQTEINMPEIDKFLEDNSYLFAD